MTIKRNLKTFLFFFILSLLFFLKVSSDFGHVESGIYVDYTASIVEDGDFNIVNQLFVHEENKYVSSTYYYPDFHSHGSVIYWNYFYSVGLQISNLLGITEEAKSTLLHVSMSFSSVIFFILGMILLPKTFSLFKIPFYKSWYFLIPILSPLYFYTFIQPGSGSVISFFMAQLFIHIYFYCLKNYSFKNYAFLGIFLGLAFITKVDSVFYGILPFHSFIYFHKEKRFLDISSKIMIYLVMFAVINIPQLFNEYLKYGQFLYGYTATVFTDYNLFWEVLFSPYHGIIYYSPVYLLVIFGLYKSIKSLKSAYPVDLKSEQLVLITLFLVGIVKLLIFSGSYSHGSGVFGGRQFMTEISTIFLLVTLFFESYQKRKLFIVLNSVLVLWSLVMMFNYMDVVKDYFKYTPWEVDFQYYITSFYSRGSEFFSYIVNLFIGFNETTLKMKYFLFYPIIFSLIITFRNRISNKKQIVLFTIFFISTYLLQTSYNYVFGKRNVFLLKDAGYFNNALVGNGPRMYFYYENMGSLNERLVLLKSQGREDEYKKVNEIRNNYHKEALSQVLIYPDKMVPIHEYYKEISTNHHMIEGMKKYNIPLLE